MVEACCIKQAMSKIRKVTEAKVQEKAKKRKHMKEEEKRKQLEYLKKLWDKVLAKNTTLMVDTENSQVTQTKYKEIVDIFLENETGLQLSKKTKGKQPRKYCRNTIVKM